MKHSRLRTTISAAVLALACTMCVHAQGIGITNGFSYTINPFDTTPSPYLPFLRPEIAGEHGFLRNDGEGDFQFEDGTPARFFGVTMDWAACYPDSTDAVLTAAHLRKMGVNLVRFQYHDNVYDWGEYGQLRTFLDAATGFTTLHAGQIRKLDWFIYQLKRNGIYTLMTLHSARAARASDGLGADADSAMWLGRELPYLYPQARAATHRVVRLLLEHTNVFTGISYKSEPAIAMFEGFDQGSLISMNRLGYTEFSPAGNTFSYRHSRRLDTLYAQFLRTRYANTAALAAAWRTPEGGFPNLMTEGSFEGEFDRYWSFQGNNGSTVTPILAQGDSVPQGTVTMKARVRNTQDTAYVYAAVMYQPVTGLEFNTAYRLSFKAKSSVPDWKILVTGSQAGGGYMGAGLLQTHYVQPYWKEYQSDFLVPIRSNVPISIAIYFGSHDGEFSIDDVQLKRVDVIGLTPNESLENTMVVRVPLATIAATPMLSSKRVEDQSDFYMSLERGYLDGLRRLVRDTLGVKQPFAGAGHYWASLVQERVIQAGYDFTMSSQGWDYVGDEGSGPMVRNYSPLSGWASYGGAIWSYAVGAHRRQPFIAGYSQPYPNRYQAEGMLMLPAYSSLQEWDGVMLDYYAEDVLTPVRHMDSASYYMIAKNPVVMSLLPFSAHIFRNRLVSPAQTTIALQHSPEIARLFPRMIYPWGYNSVPGGLNSRVVLTDKLVIDSVNASDFTQADDIAFQEQVEGQALSDTREILWEFNRGTLSLDSRKAQAVSGYLTRSGNIALRNVEVKLLSGNATATMIWVVLDSANMLGKVGTSAMALVSRTEPTGFQWLDTSRWGNWGQGPMVMDPVRMRLTFKPDDNANVVKITPLDSAGMPSGAPVRATAVDGEMEVTLDQSVTRSVWYAVELSFDPAASVGVAVENVALAAEPSITSDRTYIVYSLPAATPDLRIDAYDALGRRVRMLHAGPAGAGRGKVRFDTGDLPAGTYLVRLQDGAGTGSTTKITVIR